MSHPATLCIALSGIVALLLLAIAIVVRQTPSLDSIASDYVRIALELGERDPDSLDFATVPQALAEDIHRSYPTLDEIDRQTLHLLSQLQTEDADKQPARAQSLVYQLQAIHARVAMLHGRMLDFNSEARILFQTQALPDTATTDRIALRGRIASLLPRPVSATPSANYALYNERFLVPADRVAAVVTAALGACRHQTLAYISLPPNESIDLVMVRNKPWSAFSRFHGNARSTIFINRDFPLTVDQALELACHEGYPGHHVFNTLREIALVQQMRLPEAQVQLTFSPQSYLSESAAAYAPRIAFSLEERTQIERDLLFPLAGLPPDEAPRYALISDLVRRLDTAQPRIAQRYLDGQLEFVRAAQQLRAELLMEHSDATLLYLNQYRSYMLAYTDGPNRIAAQLGQSNSPPTPGRRLAWQRYLQLIVSAQASSKLSEAPSLR